MIKRITGYFSKGELVLWVLSVTMIVSSFCIFGGNGLLTLLASLIGVTSILINANGNPIGQLLMIIFSLMYGIISYTWRDDYISRHDDADGCSCSCFMA